MKPLEKLVSFFANSKPLRLKKGDIIVRAGETPSNVYYIKEGYTKTYSVTESGEEKILVIYPPGFMTSIVVVVGNLENKWYIEALTDVVLLKSTRDEFLKFIASDTNILNEINRKLIKILGWFTDRIDVLEYSKASSRVISDLLVLAEDFSEKKEKGVIFKIPITHKDIAGRTAMTRETASREISKLEKKRLITYKNRHIVINDIDLLKEELERCEADDSL